MSIRVCKRITKYPREAGDFGDIGDIFRNSLKLQDFLRAPDGDIHGDIFGDGDLSPSARDHRRLSKSEKVRKPEAVNAGLMVAQPFLEKNH